MFFMYRTLSLKSAALAVSLLALMANASAQQYPTVRNTQPASAGPAYWTPERMQAAKPKDVPVINGASQRVPAAAVPAAPGAPGAAGGTGEASLSPQLLDELTNGAPTPADGSYPGSNTTFTRNLAVNSNPNTVPFGQYLSYPWQTVGRLFFTEQNVGDFECSATATYGGAALNVVWTAGHCVANGGQASFYTNWLFCPAYKKGVNPNVGCWNGAGASTTNGWFYNGAFSLDYAIVLTNPTGTVRAENVVSAVGGLGFAWNWGRDQNWVHFGYPAQGPCPDGLQCVTLTEHRYDVTSDTFGPPVNSFGSAQTPGASGSPVVLSFSPNGGYINSNVSYYYSSGPNGNELGYELQGPYYDTNACAFWKAWTGWSGSC
jgi:hypothetical protein